MGKFVDLTGQRFGRLVVESFAGRVNKRSYWNCICDCGNKHTVRADILKRGDSQSCGCYNSDYHKKYAKDLTGQRFGYWTVLYRAENKGDRAAWYCRCDCGTERVVSSALLLSGESLSCGCYNRKMSSIKGSTHGMSGTRIYSIYQGMKDRCYNPNNKKYHLYGGRGIKVCDEWLGEQGFIHFMKWALDNGYDKSLSIDRYPNKDGNYEPSNCRWATYEEQSNNLKTNHLVTYKGETHTIAEWSKITGINKNTLWYRVQNSWSEDRIFSPPQN